MFKKILTVSLSLTSLAFFHIHSMNLSKEETLQPDVLVAAIKCVLKQQPSYPTLTLNDYENVRTMVQNHLFRLQLSLGNIKNAYGCTTLHFAAALGYTDVIKIILSLDKTLFEIAANEGSTALHKAAWFEQLDTIELLLNLIEKDKVLNFLIKKNNVGKSACDIAEGPKGTAVQKLLIGIEEKLRASDNQAQSTF